MGDYLLVVEHDADLRALIVEALRLAGYDVVAVAETATGLAVARQRPPSLLLLESLGDAVRDADAIRAYRGLLPLRCPIILLSAWPDAAAHAVAVAADGVLEAPFDLDRLQSLAERHARCDA